MEGLMHHKALIAPVLTYLFHRLEARFDGRPCLLVLDEAWTFLDDPLFAARIREWLKTLRKKNVAVVFATQSLADIEKSSIAPALIESCPTRILLPNERALEPQARAIYERFGLNARQIEILGLATPKRDYYAQTARGNRLFELGLGPVALALAAASSPEDQHLIDACREGEGDFAARFLAAKGLDWAADLIARWRPPEKAPIAVSRRRAALENEVLPEERLASREPPPEAGDPDRTGPAEAQNPATQPQMPGGQRAMPPRAAPSETLARANRFAAAPVATMRQDRASTFALAPRSPLSERLSPFRLPPAKRMSQL
jgi:type IV secretion system protein VirB4